jgi:hypothetical protein
MTKSNAEEENLASSSPHVRTAGVKEHRDAVGVGEGGLEEQLEERRGSNSGRSVVVMEEAMAAWWRARARKIEVRPVPAPSSRKERGVREVGLGEAATRAAMNSPRMNAASQHMPPFPRAFSCRIVTWLEGGPGSEVGGGRRTS